MSRRLVVAWLILAVLGAGCRLQDANERFIQGTWVAAGALDDTHSWYLEWTFDDGEFKLAGYPPLHQTGKYRVTDSDGEAVTLELVEQQGDLPTDDRTLLIVIDRANDSLTIDGQAAFTRSP